MNGLHTTALELAQNLFADVREVPGDEDHPMIMAALRMVETWPDHDEVAWCSALPFMVCKGLGLPVPASNGLRARSWLTVGTPVALEDARVGFDLVVLSRGDNAPGPEVLDAPGHVGFFVGTHGGKVLVWGGNQSDSACLDYFPTERVLGIRRLV